MTPNESYSSTATTSSAGDALALLTKDHRDTKKLFNSYQDLADEEAPASQRLAVTQEICAALTQHAMVEEEIFYPALRQATAGADDELDEAEVEHTTIKELVAQIQAMEPDATLYNAKVKVLGEYVDHHAKEEEREMFPKAKSSGMDLNEIGKQIRDRKEELQTVQID